MIEIKTNTCLKKILCKSIKEINDQEINTNKLIVLILSPPTTAEAPGEKPCLYSEADCDEVRAMIEQIRNNSASLKDLPRFQGRDCKYAECVGKEESYRIQCLMLEEMVNYYGVLQYILEEIGRTADYFEFTEDKLTDLVAEKLELENRTIVMERYVQRFLQKENLPSAELLIELSAQKYEGSESEARIYIENKDIKDEYRTCTFSTMGDGERVLESGKLRTVRKLMEMSKRKALYLLASQEMHIVGMISFAVKKGEEREKEEEKINRQSRYISFNGYMKWSVYINGREEICYKQGKYYINSSSGKDTYEMQVEKFEKRVAEKGEDIPIWLVRELVTILCAQRHGTTVILTNDTEEAKRLCEVDRGILLDKESGQNFKDEDVFDKDKLLSVTEIDGALFMDLTGKCTAFGVIVDGIASMKGNPGRGARYNSIYNYIHQQKDQAVYIALIFSEDGGVDIIDNFDDRKKKEKKIQKFALDTKQNF